MPPAVITPCENCYFALWLSSKATKYPRLR
jgi:hypothetical protein